MVEFRLRTTAFGWGGARTPDDLTVRASNQGNTAELYLSVQDLFIAHSHLQTHTGIKRTLGTNVVFDYEPDADTVEITSGSFTEQTSPAEFTNELESLMSKTFFKLDISKTTENRNEQLQEIQKYLNKDTASYDVIDQYNRLK